MAEEKELEFNDEHINLDDQDMLRAVLHSVRGISPISSSPLLEIDLDSVEE